MRYFAVALGVTALATLAPEQRTARAVGAELLTGLGKLSVTVVLGFEGAGAREGEIIGLRGAEGPSI